MTCSELILTTAPSTCFDTAEKPLLKSATASLPDDFSGWLGELVTDPGPETRFRTVSNFISTARAASASTSAPSPSPNFVFLDAECKLVSAFKVSDFAYMALTPEGDRKI